MSAAVRRRIGGALLRYRVMAIVTGTMLALLVFVAMPLKYFWHHPGPAAVIGTAHGFLFMVYLVTAVDLAARVRWPLLRLILVLVAGTIPLMSFFMERSVTHELTGAGPGAEGASRRAGEPAGAE